ncbi:hypothetical protein SAMN05444396_106266 [Flavobacterium segetis]|uniref:Uncharacterized protein n=1 Tax=Flavobacterium segetis TaxID=271157 RepID=A0A1M5I9X2_9FLAO|nr:hypothetical protein SAMN05444396_106266 [Flavobacterium segetis]
MTKLKTEYNMKDTTLFTMDNGTFIMVVVFGLVIVGLVAAIFIMMNSDKKVKK